MLSYINWDFDPFILQWGFLRLGWYGILFAGSFVLGYYLMLRMFKHEGRTQEQLDSLTLYMAASTFLGARLGHVLFYSPDYYLSNPIEILKVWEGGLASHGAAIGILFGLWLFARKQTNIAYLWMVDRIVITVALAGCMIRLGNLANSEIYGEPTDVPWAFIFTRLGDNIPRHPTQIYESFAYLCIFLFLNWQYRRLHRHIPQGYLLGLFLILVFGFRFCIEFMKAPQVAFESTMSLNMGQLLSIPFVLLGVWLVGRVWKQLPGALAAAKADKDPFVKAQPAKA